MESKRISMAYHQFLYFAKIFLIFFAAVDFISMFSHELTDARILEQVFAVGKAAVLLLSVLFHEKKSGAVLLCVYFTAELAWFYMIVLLSGAHMGMFSGQVWDYSCGTALILIPTVLYYSKRWKSLT